ncbi:MAG: protein kinase domain-containing protein [Deltaproteobacteria bacterium]
MGLASGNKIGPYEIVSPLGAGGMGEVYRARDATLGRDVALKVLPDLVSRDPERTARFKREAQVLASLNHPNIAAIYGFEESTGVRALVMELVEGETIAERLKQGALPIEDALSIARQTAEALEAAHDRGIVHRDLKPANIKITHQGSVKVLDFGLAKALENDASGSSSVSNSPTLTVAATQAGVILGTAAYMAPEQAKGKPADRRADIWAFGCVLYEMLSGLRPFDGETVSDVLAGVIRAEPDWKAMPAATPPRIGELVRRCLIKDPKHRLQAIGDARITIEELSGGANDSSSALTSAVQVAVAPPVGPASRRLLPWAIAGLLLIACALLAVGYVSRKPIPAPSVQATISLPTELTQPDLDHFALSPDGRRLAFVAAASGERPRVWIRPLDSPTAQPLAGTDGATYPFWSPDSRYIGFFADGKLKKIDASGGAAQSLCDATEGRGGTWGPKGDIVFAPGIYTGIYQVAESGGTPVQLTSLSNSGDSDRFPSFLPDGEHVLFLYLTGSGKKDLLQVVSLNSKEVKTIAEIRSDAFYDPSGYLVYQREGSLVAQKFDVNNFTLSGDAFPIVDQIAFIVDRGNVLSSISNNGVMVYRGGKLGGDAQLTWFDREGNRLQTLGQPAQIFQPVISPDGKKVVEQIIDASGKGTLWTVDVARGVPSRFTFQGPSDGWPVWSPDGKQIAYESNRGGNLEIFVKAASGVEEEKPLVTEEGESMPTDWSRDGRFLAYQKQSRTTKKFDIWILPMTGDRKTFSFIATEANEFDGVFSPDGRWLAYLSNETGRSEAYVVPFPGRSGKWQVSSGGAEWIFWVNGGKEIDYITPDSKWMAAEVNARGDEFSIGATKAVFGGKSLPGSVIQPGLWITPDGKRLLMPITNGNSSIQFSVMTNWRVQVKK